MADDSIKNCSQESVSEDEMPAIVTDLKDFQVLIQDQATDFMDVLLDRTFIKLFKEDLTEDEKQQLGALKFTFLENFREIIGNTFEDIVNHDSIQYLLNEIMETTSKVTESPEYLEEVYPIRTDFLKKLKDFKGEIDASNEVLSKEREAQYSLLKDEMKATKMTKNLLIKVSAFCICSRKLIIYFQRLRKVNQEMVDHISELSSLTRVGSDE